MAVTDATSPADPLAVLGDPHGPQPHSLPAGGHRQAVEQLRRSLNAALKGKADVVESVLAGLLARGHLLIEDLPGLGKTTLAKALAVGIGGKFARVQCTPDLLPSDVTGFNLFDQRTREFEFQAGPVFADVLLADEINRATPRTQSALFEAMAEWQVTVDNVRRPLAETFLVIATQNPVEHHGTYPLPEAQLDRFALKLSVGYPDREHEMDMLEAAVGQCVHHAAYDTPALTPRLLGQVQDHVAAIAVTRPVQAYLVDLGRATRKHKEVRLGLSPRGLLIWQRVAQAHAFLAGRTFATPDDVQAVARPVLSVRLGMDAAAADATIGDILASVRVPA